jgi:hypothetical protein
LAGFQKVPNTSTLDKRTHITIPVLCVTMIMIRNVMVANQPTLSQGIIMNQK